MSTGFTQQLAEWQPFYAALAAIAATLAGLLFVSLSLNIDYLNNPRNRAFKWLARQAFIMYMMLVLYGLTFLIPHQNPIIFGLFMLFGSLVGMVSSVHAIVDSRNAHEGITTITLFARYGFTFIVSLGIAVVAVAMLFGNADLLYVMVGLVFTLLIVATYDAWMLLMDIRIKQPQAESGSSNNSTPER